MAKKPRTTVRIFPQHDKIGEDVIARFMSFVMPEPNSGCWLWAGSVGKKGYGQFQVKTNGKWSPRQAHRISYEIHVGPIPDGLQLDHLCRNPYCCNPQHLEPVTNKENGLRGVSGQWQKAKTHCPRGHEYTPENTISGRGGRHRACRKCHYAVTRRYYFSKKQAP